MEQKPFSRLLFIKCEKKLTLKNALLLFYYQIISISSRKHVLNKLCFYVEQNFYCLIAVHRKVIDGSQKIVISKQFSFMKSYDFFNFITVNNLWGKKFCRIDPNAAKEIFFNQHPYPFPYFDYALFRDRNLFIAVAKN